MKNSFLRERDKKKRNTTFTKKKALLILFLVCGILTQLSAQEAEEPFEMPFGPNEDRIYSLFSPDLALERALGFSSSSPFGLMLNPASGSLFSQLTIEFNYTQGFGYGQSYLAPESADPVYNAFGYFLNGGVTIPTVSGSFTVLGSFLYSNALSFPVEMYTGGGFYYSHLVKENLAIGGGIKAFGSIIPGQATPSWSFTGDFGIIHTPRNVKHVEDFLWGFALRNIGWGTANVDNTFLSLFTPEVNVNFNFFKQKGTSLGFFSSMSLPALQSLEIQAGLSVKYDDMITFAFATTFRLDDFLAETKRYANLIPALILKYSYRSAKQEDATEDFSVELTASTFAIENQIWTTGLGIKSSFGTRVQTLNFGTTQLIYVDEPILYEKYDKITFEQVDYIANQDIRIFAIPNSTPILESFDIPVRVKQGIKIKKFYITVFDLKKKTILRDEIFAEKGQVDKGDVIYFDATHPITSKNIPYGIYNFQIEAEDTDGRIYKTIQYKFLLDDISYLYVKQAQTRKEKFVNTNREYLIEQFGSYELEWQFTISNSLTGIVKKGSIRNGQPEEFLWDGLSDNGMKAPDGIYTYEIFCISKRGNKVSGGIKTFYIDSGDFKIFLELTTNIFDIDVHKEFRISPTTENIRNVSWWKIDILDSKQDLVFETDKYYNIPTDYRFKGYDKNGEKLKPGFYSARIIVSYTSGDIRIALSETFEIR
ncbi:MAG: hypothetical protein JXR63_08670 [Spirochaetales bacterium]|nr:hypothetical protein [Spirochaetales bacterium]